MLGGFRVRKREVGADSRGKRLGKKVLSEWKTLEDFIRKGFKENWMVLWGGSGVWAVQQTANLGLGQHLDLDFSKPLVWIYLINKPNRD